MELITPAGWKNHLPKKPSGPQFRDLRFDLPCTRPMNQIRGFEADHKDSTTTVVEGQVGRLKGCDIL